MADQAKIIIRFGRSAGDESPTVWKDCHPPRPGDLATITHKGSEWVVKCGSAVIGWEGGAQVFGVYYKPMHKVEG